MQPFRSSRVRLLKVAAVFISVVITAWFASFLYVQAYRYFSGRYLILEMRTSVSGYGKVFFDTGSSYQEDESYRFEINPSSYFEKYLIPLPRADIKAIRFDPVEDKGIFQIKSLMVQVRGKDILWEGATLAQRIVPQQQITAIDEGTVFTGESTGDDPNFYVRDLLIPNDQKPLLQTLLVIAAFIAGMTFMGGILVWLIPLLLRLGRLCFLSQDSQSFLGRLMHSWSRPLVFFYHRIAQYGDMLQQHHLSKQVFHIALLCISLFWVRVVWSIFMDTGLFRWLGTDFALYFSQATALWSGDAGAIYRPEALDMTFQHLLNRYSPGHPEIHSTHVPYLPVFAWLFTPFTAPPPPLGFFLWAVIHVVAVIYLASRIMQFFPSQKLPWVTLILLISFPVAYSLLVGQLQLLMACAVAECYQSLRDERDFRAGAWLSLLLFKPQYGFLIGIFLIWKRRWAAVAGVAVGGMIIIGGSMWVGGMETLLAYPTAFTDMAKFFSEDVHHMINWRSLVMTFKPVLTEDEGMMLTSSLAYVTIFFAVLAWRGPWLPRDPRFPARFTLLLLATLLISHHSFNYGAVILIVPTAAALAEGRHDRFMHMSVIVGILFPAVSFVVVHVADAVLASRILTFSIMSLYVALSFWLVRYTKTMGYRIKAC